MGILTPPEGIQEGDCCVANAKLATSGLQVTHMFFQRQAAHRILLVIDADGVLINKGRPALNEVHPGLQHKQEIVFIQII